MEQKQNVIAVVGPTATGKTSLGIALSRALNGEIISCDSMQIYRGLAIGTAQPTAEERAAVPHHLIDFLDVTENFSVSDYVKSAASVIETLAEKGKLPVLVGGTGLYVRALLRGFSFEEHAREDHLREELFQKADVMGPQTLYEELQALDPEGAAEIHPNNLKRVVRALEYCKLTGEPFSSQARRSKMTEPPYRSLLLVLSCRNREVLYQRIDRRVDTMLERGLLEEAKGLFELCGRCEKPPTASQAIGYKELFPYFRGEVPLEEAVEDLKRESRRYAKRQITWFSHEPEATALYLDDYETGQELVETAIQVCEAFLAGRGQQNEQ